MERLTVHSILNEAQLAQRDASRRLFFVAAGCLHHPRAELVFEADPTVRYALEQSVDAALQFAELSEAEVERFTRRAVAETRVVRNRDGTYSFRQPDRPPRRKWRKRDLLRCLVSSSPISVAPSERRDRMTRSAAMLNLVGVVATTWLAIKCVRAVQDAGHMLLQGSLPEIGLLLLGAAFAAIAAILLWNVVRP